MNLPVKTALASGIPLLAMTAIGIALIAQGKPSDGRSTLAVGVIVAAVSGSAVIYHIDRWSLRRQSVVHFTVMVATVLPALLLSGWFPLGTASGYVTVIGVFLVAGLALWSVFYLIFTKLSGRPRNHAKSMHKHVGSPTK